MARSAGASPASAADGRDRRDLHVRDDRRLYRGRRDHRTERRDRLVDRARDRPDHDRSDRAHRTARLAHDRMGNRALEDGHAPPGVNDHGTVFFALAALFGHKGYTHADVSAGSYILTVVGFGFLTLGGWLGGAVVFVHGMRVLSLVNEPAERAVAPVPHPEKEQAEGA